MNNGDSPLFNKNHHYIAIMISFLLSGGTNNSNPNMSLGGLPSMTPVSAGLNALFSQVTTNEASKGGSVFRCIYAVNDSELTLGNTIVSIESSKICTSKIGFNLSDEVQRLTFLGNPTSGTFKLKYNVLIDNTIISQTTNDISYSINGEITAKSIQQRLNSLTYLSTVSVESIDNKSYNIIFQGNDGKRSQYLLEVVDLSISGCTGSQIDRVTEGSPINQLATSTGYENQSPYSVSFEEDSVNIGDLRIGDIFSFWIKRTTKSGTASSTMNVDNCTIGITFESF